MSRTMFLPWLRSGLAGFLPAGGAGPQAADPVLSMKVALTGKGADEAPIEHTIQLRGPGHVVALDPAVISREEPPRSAQKVVPTTFPHVELREPDLPWRHSPVGAKNGRVPPWIVLVCVEVRDGVRLEWQRQSGCHVLHVDGALVQTELPDLSEAWAWAHVHVSGLADKDGPLDDAGRPHERASARLVCPRRLRPFRRYLCALVPAFRAGVEAARGEVPETTDLTFAWTKQTREALALPVFHSWSFATGEDGDFEDLVDRLRPRAAPPDLGERPLHVVRSTAMDVAADTPPARLRGALRAPAGTSRPVEEFTPPAVTKALAEAWQVQTGDDDDDDPLVLPPVYGAGHAATKRPDWLAQLNSHPAHRVGAGLGAEVVLRHQEELVAASWDQLEQARAAAVALRQAQIAAEIARTQAQRVIALSPGDALQLTSRAHARMLDVEGKTVRARLLAEGLPDGVLAPRLRRLTRGGSPIARGRAAGEGTFAGSLATRALEGSRAIVRAAAWTRPDGLVIGKVAPVQPPPTAPAQAKPLKLQLRPLDQHVARLRGRLGGDAAPKFDAEVGLPDALRLMPEFEVPLSRWLVDIEPELVLPGLGEVPDDTVMVLQPNRAFLEAVIAGANDALARELAWREFPVDLRGTAFRVFWDGADGFDAGEMRAWAGKLGANPAPKLPNAANAGVLLRGELFRRYPDVIIYLGRRDGNTVNTQAPTCFGRLTADTCYALFAETLESLRNDWSVVFEEVPGAPRFGLDSPREPAGGVPADENSISWSHFATGSAAVESLTHAPAVKPASWSNRPARVGEWGTDSGAIARLTLQRPIRYAVPLSSLLPAD